MLLISLKSVVEKCFQKTQIRSQLVEDFGAGPPLYFVEECVDAEPVWKPVNQ